MTEQVYINLPARSFGELADLFTQMSKAFPNARDIHLEEMCPVDGENGIRVIWTREDSDGVD